MKQVDHSKENRIGWADELTNWFINNPDYCNSNPFLNNFRLALPQTSVSHSPGNRTTISTALEAGLDGLFTSLSWTRSEEMETFVWGSGNGYKKKLDRVYVKDKDIIAVEVKSAMEFNHLAAALVEGRLLKSSASMNKARFVVVSLASKLGKQNGQNQAHALAKEILQDAKIVILVPELQGNPGDTQRWGVDACKLLIETLDEFTRWIQPQPQ